MVNIEYNILFLGFSKTGKTHFIKKLLYGDSIQSHSPTIGINDFSYEIKYKNKLYTLILWDCGGEYTFTQLDQQKILNCHLVLIFDDPKRDNALFNSYVPKGAKYVHVSMDKKDAMINILSTIKYNIINYNGGFG
jgi:small GTP-binding protein